MDRGFFNLVLSEYADTVKLITLRDGIYKYHDKVSVDGRVINISDKCDVKVRADVVIITMLPDDNKTGITFVIRLDNITALVFNHPDAMDFIDMVRTTSKGTYKSKVYLAFEGYDKTDTDRITGIKRYASNGAGVILHESRMVNVDQPYVFPIHKDSLKACANISSNIMLKIPFNGELLNIGVIDARHVYLKERFVISASDDVYEAEAFSVVASDHVEILVPQHLVFKAIQEYLKTKEGSGSNEQLS